MMADDGEMLTLGEAALMLGVSRVTLRRWTNAGLLPHYRVGMRRDRRFRRNDLERYIQRSTKRQVSDDLVSAVVLPDLLELTPHPDIPHVN